MATVNWSLQHKRDTAANWTSNNPILLAGQLGIETDNLTTTPKFKIGDGTSSWTALPYFYGGSASAQDLNNVLSVGNTTSGNNIVMSGTDVISDSTGTNMFVDLNATTIYSTDGYNRMAFTADISGKTSEISVRDYSVITLEKGYVSAGLTDIYSGVISQSTGWYNQIHTNLSHIEVQSNWANFRGIEYLNDWSANYSLRSLVDKGYIINNFVPYTGATSDVDLGTFLLSTRSIRVTGTAGSGDIHLRHQSTDATATGQSTSLFADVNGDLKWKNDGNYYTTLKTSTNTANRIYTYPDADGTIALTSNKLSQFATTTSSELAGVISDETGTGALVFGTSPTFTTDITTPLIIGGSAVGSTIQYKGTSGNGTSTVAAHQFLVGNNGATTAASIYNSGQVSVGNYASPNNLRILTIGQDTAYMSFGSLVGTTSVNAIYFNQATPSATNYSIYGSANQTRINASTDILLRIADATKFNIDGTTTTLQQGVASSGAITTYTFTKPNNTGQTASTPINGFLFTTGSRQWATGAITTQKEFEITSPTYTFVGASTITNAYTLYVNAPTASTNATITNNYAAGFNGNVLVGTTSNNSQRILQISQDTAYMSFGSLVGTTSSWAFYGNQATPSATNPWAYGTSTDTFINAGSSAGNVYLQAGGNTLLRVAVDRFVAQGVAQTSGAQTNFTFTVPANTGQTASTEITNFKVTGNTKTWSAGAITTQRWNYFTANTAAFASASTITNSYGLYVEAATAGTNATITNNWGIGFTGGLFKNSIGNTVLSNAALSTSATDGFLYIPTSAGAPTGVPTSFTGVVAMQYDTTNNKLYIYNGAWKSVTLA